MPRTARSGYVTTDHDEIRNWVEERGGSPAAVKRRTRGDAGILRIDFPGFTGKNLQHISWDEWFKTFDDSKLAFLHRDQDRFNKLVRRGREQEERKTSKTSSRRGGARRATSASRQTETGSAKGGAKRSTPARGKSRTSSSRSTSKSRASSKRSTNRSRRSH